MKLTIRLVLVVFLIIGLFGGSGCDCDDDCADCPKSTVIIDDDDDDDFSDDDDDVIDDDDDDNGDDDDDDDDTVACASSVSMPGGQYYMPFRVNIYANCDGDIYYKRERFDGSGDTSFIQASNPVYDIYMDRDTTLYYYYDDGAGYTEPTNSDVYQFPPRHEGLLYIHSGDNELTLQWDAAWDEHGPVSYNIYNPESGQPIPGLTPIANTTGIQYTVTSAEISDISNGDVECFVVRAIDGTGMENQNYGQYCLAPQPVIYVDAAAPGGGDGSVGNPYNSIQDANDSMTRWFTGIWVAGGTYNESLDFTLNDPPNPVPHITAAQIFGGFDSSNWQRDLENQPTIVDGGSASYAWKPGEWDLLDGFQVTNATTGILLDDRMSVTLRNLVVHNNTVGLEVNALDVNSSPTVVGSLFALNGDGVIFHSEADTDSDVGVFALFRNNIVYGNTQTGILLDGTGNGAFFVYLWPDIHNNVIGNNTNFGINGNVSGTNLDMYAAVLNNFIGDNGTDMGCTGCNPANYENQFNNILNPGIFTGFANISLPPQFINPPYDFHLDLMSPMIDMGIPDLYFSDPDGSRNNIGCFGGVGANWKPQPFAF